MTSSPAGSGRTVTSVLMAAVLIGAFTGISTTWASAAAKAPSWTKNCTVLNKKYPHGVGKAKARDKVQGKTRKRPVTSFKRSDSLYNQAMKYNKRLDADKDGIACER